MPSTQNEQKIVFWWAFRGSRHVIEVNAQRWGGGGGGGGGGGAGGGGVGGGGNRRNSGKLADVDHDSRCTKTAVHYKAGGAGGGGGGGGGRPIRVC